MKWLGTQRELIEFVKNILPDHELIERPGTYAATIVQCFVDKRGRAFNRHQLIVVAHGEFQKVKEKRRIRMERAARKEKC